MGKMTKLLKKAEQERLLFRPDAGRSAGTMKRSWFFWFVVLAVVFSGFFGYQYYQRQKNVSLTEIFPDQETVPVEIEYEFGDSQVIDSVTPVGSPVVQAESVPVKKEAEIAKAAETVPVKAAEQKSSPEKQSVSLASDPAGSVKEETPWTYTIQLASFKTEEKAQESIAELQKQGYNAFVLKRDLGERGTWFRVYVDRFVHKKDAEAFWNTFSQKYPQSFIIAPQK